MKAAAKRGGNRAGAGSKAISDLGRRKREQIIKAVEVEAKLNRTSFGRELARLIFNPSGDKRLKLAAMQLYMRDVLPRMSENEVTDARDTGPAVYLPEHRHLIPILNGSKNE